MSVGIDNFELTHGNSASKNLLFPFRVRPREGWCQGGCATRSSEFRVPNSESNPEHRTRNPELIRRLNQRAKSRYAARIEGSSHVQPETALLFSRADYRHQYSDH